VRLAILLLALCPFGAALAQDSTSGKSDAKAPLPRLDAVACAGQIITDIIVTTQPPYTMRLPGDLEILRKTVRTLHSTTRGDVIRRYMLLNVGDACDPVRLAESERIMRAQPFLVDARITPLSDDQGGVRLEVVTRDEFSLVFQASAVLKSPVLRSLKVGESNLAGGAMYVAAQWKDGGAYRDQIGVRLEDYQFAGQADVLRVFATRFPQGHDFALELLRPYLTDLQHFGWRGKVGGTRSYEAFLRPDLATTSVGVNREFQDIGGVGRIGEVGRLQLVGASISHEAVKIDGNTVIIARHGYQYDSAGTVPSNLRNQDVTRVNFLGGVRRLRFARVYGFDALNGVQDIRVGLQVGGLYGLSVPWLGSRDHDSFVLGDLYAGYGNSHSYLGMQSLTEARRDRTLNSWQGVLSSGRLAWYLKPAIKQLTLTEILWSTGTSVQVPYQLSFADPEGGMHGYHSSRQPGAHRVVMRAEQRALITSRYNVADFGAAAFVEAGKLWGDKTPFARDSPIRGSVGLSLLAAIPPKSRRMWRIDFAMPVGGDPDARFEIRISNLDRTRAFAKDPVDVARARERAVPTSIFNWP
jgi:hypothetical protein